MRSEDGHVRLVNEVHKLIERIDSEVIVNDESVTRHVDQHKNLTCVELDMGTAQSDLSYSIRAALYEYERKIDSASRTAKDAAPGESTSPTQRHQKEGSSSLWDRDLRVKQFVTAVTLLKARQSLRILYGKKLWQKRDSQQQRSNATKACTLLATVLAESRRGIAPPWAILKEAARRGF